MNIFNKNIIIFLEIILLGLMVGSASYAQSQSSFFIVDPKPANIDTIYHDEKSQTIDIFFTATLDNQPFWDFNKDNLIVKEKINGKTLSLKVILQSRITQKDWFGDKEVYQIKTQSGENYHSGLREYIISWQDAENGAVLHKATIHKDWSILGAFTLKQQLTFADTLVLGLLFVSFLLLILTELIPILRKVSFEKKYVHPYSSVQRPDEKALHPVTGKPLQPSEAVVTICSCHSPYKMWKKRDYRCPNYPRSCNGTVNIGSGQFFTQSGLYKKLNWLWFGALGGLLAWLLSWGLSRATGLNETLIMGISLGAGLTFAIALVEELGLDISILRVLIKTIIGTIAAGLIFLIFWKIDPDGSALGTALTLIIFCLALGLILSIKSSISLKRGIISGLIAGFASGLIYFVFSSIINEAELLKMLTFVLLGTTLGVGIIQIVKGLDKIELEVIMPSYRNGVIFSLDKRLNNGETVSIGRDMRKSDIRVKWEDEEVLAQHAEISMRSSRVYIKPLGEAIIWVNDTPLQSGSAKALSGGEKIRLGRRGVTVFKYLQKS